MKVLRLKELLKQKDLINKDFAKTIGVTEVTVSKLCKGSVIPRKDLLVRIANVLDVDIKDLFVSTKETELIQLIVKNKLHTFDGVDNAIKFLQNESI